jgi:hypothetical protein
MRSWARAIESYEDVPGPYKGFFEGMAHGADSFPYAVLTPRYEGFLRQEQEKLVCCPDRNLHILQSKDGKLAQTTYRLRDIHYVEIGNFLLQSWIKVRGVSSDGLLTTTLKFNTVSERLFGPIVDRVRAGAPQAVGVDLNAEQAKLREIDGLSLKLLNFGKSSILPGELVARAIWQPEIQAEVLSVLGRHLSRMVSNAHLGILTSQEVIVVRDNPSKDSKYGVTRFFVPLGGISSVSLNRGRDSQLVASLHFPEDDHLDLLYSPSKEGEVERFLEQLRSAVSEAETRRAAATGN